jgi:hypothetical protein
MSLVPVRVAVSCCNHACRFHGILCTKRANLQGINMTEIYLDAMVAAGITPVQAHTGLVVQCFSLPALEEFAAAQRQRSFDIPLVWLVPCEAGLPGEDDVRRLQKLASHTAVGYATEHQSLLLQQR